MLGDCKIEIKIENRIKIGLIHFELCMFLFFVKNVIFYQFWEKQILEVREFQNENQTKCRFF